ncbi:MAG: valine--tRNA ligase [Candidatus Brocadiia bacterium]
MESIYKPSEVEPRIQAKWEALGIGRAKVADRKKPFSVVIPPPNVTGILHMGHVMDETPQDIIVRFKRMQGFETAWVPGTDHAGIATQNMVEKKLAEEGVKRHDIGRHGFLKRVWEWKEKFGGTIIQQLKRLGCSCDWERLRFTMDEPYSAAVTEVFVRLYEKGLIYRGDYIINWCPRCQTALSDEEVEHQDIEGGLYWIKYPIADSPEFITVATTRPETILGDTAVAVHPSDKRYKGLVGKTVLLPIVNRRIPIIADPMVSQEFGSGAVKVTPAHDPNDFQLAGRHNLPFIKVFDETGRMNENAGLYKGLDRFECRKRIVADLEQGGLYEKKDKHLHAVGHCYRCNTVIEPYLSKQWFVKMKPLAEPAIKAVQDGRVKFYPERWSKVYMEWMSNIRDWCISRQLWWGHRIPIWYCIENKTKNSNECPPIAARTAPAKCPHCGGTELEQDPDVLDTWFSSWLWPFAVFGWPAKTPDLKYFYPTAWLNSGKDIIFFWVSRMIMAGLEFMGDVPFRHVYIHGIARDERGRKLSKTLGNSPDPLDLMSKYSADALRFGIMANIPLGGDICLNNNTYESGRNFCTKLWNASRLVISNLPDYAGQAGIPSADNKADFYPHLPEDRWILSRLNSTIRDYTNALEKYEFSQAAYIAYHFFWSEFCDWYLEIAKPRLYKQAGVDPAGVDIVLRKVFSSLLRMLHPYIPFITEELWERFGFEPVESIARADWPKPDERLFDLPVEKTFGQLMSIVRGVRDIRNKMDIDKRKPLKLVISANSDGMLKDIRQFESLIKHLGAIEQVEWGINAAKPQLSATEVVGDIQIFIPLEGIIDIAAEKKRIEGKLKKLTELLAASKNKLADDNFRKRAPEVIVEREEALCKELSDQSARLSDALKDLLG